LYALGDLMHTFQNRLPNDGNDKLAGQLVGARRFVLFVGVHDAYIRLEEANSAPTLDTIGKN
jgi:hypothetical protein